MLVYIIPLACSSVPQAVGYIELQKVQLRTIDGKEVVQLSSCSSYGPTDNSSAPAPPHKSTLFVVGAAVDFGSANIEPNENVGTILV